MFEDSLVESRIASLSSSKRWTTLASISLQFAIVAVVITLPLLHPELLPFRIDTPKVLLPLPPKPPEPAVRQDHPAAAASSSATLPSAPLLMPSLLPGRAAATNDAPLLASIGNTMGTPSGLPAGLADSGSGNAPRVVVAAPKPSAGPLSISSGVSQGMLLAPIRPVYPAIARAAHVAGSVVVEATISQTGIIEGLRVLSGPVMLRSAAIDAIRAARYQPYRLNGQATAVQTTITVNFKMDG